MQGKGEKPGVSEVMLLVALGCGRLKEIFDIASRQPFVVFGTMDGEVFAGLAARGLLQRAARLPVYFYETG